MKIIALADGEFDLRGVYNLGSTKNIYATVRAEDVRKSTRERKVIFPRQKQVEKERRPHRVCRVESVKLYEEQEKKPTEEILTSEEISALIKSDELRLKEKEASEFQLVLDCQLYFPEEEVEE